MRLQSSSKNQGFIIFDLEILNKVNIVSVSSCFFPPILSLDRLNLFKHSIDSTRFSLSKEYYSKVFFKIQVMWLHVNLAKKENQKSYLKHCLRYVLNFLIYLMNID